MGWKNDLRASWRLRPLGSQRRKQRSPSNAPLWIDLQRWRPILVPLTIFRTLHELLHASGCRRPIRRIEENGVVEQIAAGRTTRRVDVPVERGLHAWSKLRPDAPYLVPHFRDPFLSAGMFGIDLLWRHRLRGCLLVRRQTGWVSNHMCCEKAPWKVDGTTRRGGGKISGSVLLDEQKAWRPVSIAGKYW